MLSFGAFLCEGYTACQRHACIQLEQATPWAQPIALMRASRCKLRLRLARRRLGEVEVLRIESTEELESTRLLDSGRANDEFAVRNEQRLAPQMSAGMQSEVPVPGPTIKPPSARPIGALPVAAIARPPRFASNSSRRLPVCESNSWRALDRRQSVTGL